MNPILRYPEFSDPWKKVTIGEVLKDMRGGASLTPVDFVNIPEGKVIPKKAIVAGGQIDFGNTRTYCRNEFFEDNPSNQIDKSYLVTTLRDLVPSGPTIGYIVENEEEGRFILAQGVYGILPDEKKIVPALLAAISNRDWYRKQMRKIMVGSTQVHIRNGDFTSLSISIPSLKEQAKIAEFLGAVDEKIRLLEARHEQLTLYKKAMMQKIFSRAIRFRREDGGVFPDWEIRALSELTEIVNGLTYSPSDVVSKGTLVLRSSNVQNGKLDFNDCVFVEMKIPPHIMSQEGDILLCVRNGSRRLIGKSAYVCKLDMPATHGAFMSVLRAKYPRFVFQLLNTERFLKLVHMDLGATINSINSNNLKKYKFFVPSSEAEQQKIADFLSAIDDKIDVVSAQITQMQSFKKGLLQQMFV